MGERARWRIFKSPPEWNASIAGLPWVVLKPYTDARGCTAHNAWGVYSSFDTALHGCLSGIAQDERWRQESIARATRYEDADVERWDGGPE